MKIPGMLEIDKVWMSQHTFRTGIIRKHNKYFKYNLCQLILAKSVNYRITFKSYYIGGLYYFMFT